MTLVLVLPPQAAHPCHSHSYAPAVVEGIEEQKFGAAILVLRFYDDTIAGILQDACVGIPSDKVDYNALVAQIRKRESEMVESEVVCRQDSSGLYFRGKVDTTC